MVPHIKGEEKLHELLEADGQVLAVTAIPDEKKGERLVVVHTLKEDALKDCLEKLSKSDLPALWKPRPDQFVYVEQLPYLGTGKLDLRRLREIAMAQGTVTNCTCRGRACPSLLCSGRLQKKHRFLCDRGFSPSVPIPLIIGFC